MSELVIDQWGAFLGVKNGCFYVKERGGKVIEISPSKLEHISIRVAGVGVSASAIALASKYGIDLTVYSGGRPVSKVVSAKSGGGIETKHAQLVAAKSSRAVEAAKAFVAGKLYNQRMVIYQRAKEAIAKGDGKGREIELECERIKAVMELLASATTIDEVRAYEAQGALRYWKAVSLILPIELGFMGREAHDPKDCFNKALNVGYGVLRSVVWSAVLAANMDPYIGFLHVPHGRHMCLVSDLMEEFRPPIVDRPIIAVALNQTEKIKRVEAEKGRSVVEAVRKALNAHDKLLERAVFEQARRLASWLRGSIPSYTPYKLRW